MAACQALTPADNSADGCSSTTFLSNGTDSTMTSTPSATPSALSGIRVIDMSRVFAAPMGAQILGDLGADVIKIERPGVGDDGRGYGTAWLKGKDGIETRQSSFFTVSNRNKRSITVNHSKPEGQEIIRKLAENADVLIENYKVGDLARFGLDYESLKAIKPDIIMSSSSAYGSGGPYSKRIGFDGVGQVMSGAVHRSGTPEQPVRAAVPYVDYSTALSGFAGVLAALLYRNKTGEGQHIESNLIGTALMISSSFLIEQAVLKANREATLNRGQLGAPVDLFRVKDGWLLVQVAGQPMYERWCKLMGEDHWRTDPRFATDVLRGKHGEIISKRMQEWCDSRTKAEAVAELEGAKIPAYPVYSAQDALDDPHVKAMGYLKYVEYDGLDEPAPIVGTPFKMSKTPPTLRLNPPRSGQHTEEVLHGLGFDDAKIAELREHKVI